MSFLEIKDVEKSYGEKRVLTGFSLCLEKGEMVAVMGRSGCGKSTLLHILSGVESMDSGSYLLNGKDLSRYDRGKMAKMRNRTIGYITQSYALIPNMTARENIMLPLTMRKIYGVKEDGIVETAANRLGLDSLLDQKVCRLSGGEKQRVAIARALIIDPAIILADEPTGALDDETTEDIMSLLAELKKAGHTFLIATHSSLAAQYADRVIRMT